VFTDLAVVLSDGGQRDGDIVPGSAGRRGMPVDVQSCGLDGKPAVTSMHLDHVHRLDA